jgi:hypothetical protein
MEVKMIITGKRKRKLDKRLGFLIEGKKVNIGVPVNEDNRQILKKIGFTELLNEGETVLPRPIFGSISRFNAEGKYLIHKDQPMETAYRQREWSWEQWAGYHETETKSKIVDVPYKRYPRTFIPPPSVELSVVINRGNKKYIVAPEQILDLSNSEKPLHIINLFLEIFGYCEILTEDLGDYVLKNVRRLNWEILPPGKWPWNKIKDKVLPIIQQTNEQKQTVVIHRLKTITKFEPDFSAIGRAGFRGYIIFGFTNKNIYTLESIFTGNATYVFGEKWQSLSQLTKAEILEESLQKDRIIHRKKWDKHINNLLK